jgi:methylglyoxal synthase
VQEDEADANSLFRLCDSNNIPFATNIATAEILINGLERGDLAWRELVKPAVKPKNV